VVATDNKTDTAARHPGSAAGAKRFRLRPADLLVIGCGLALTALASWLVYAGPAPSSLVVQAAGRNYVYPLSVDTIINIPGNLGMTVIEIKNSAVHIIDSPCRNKTCISSGWLRGTGNWSACLPNAVFLRIEGSQQSDDAIDAVLH